MRHQQYLEKDSFTKVDMAAVWPASAQVAPLPVADIEQPVAVIASQPEAAARDVPVAVGGLIVGAYATLIATFAIATTGSGQSLFAIGIAVFFAVMFFAIPTMFFGLEPKQGRIPSLSRFMRDGMQTLTGHSSGGAALVQMLIVPVFLTLGAAAMGIAAALIF